MTTTEIPANAVGLPMVWRASINAIVDNAIERGDNIREAVVELIEYWQRNTTTEGFDWLNEQATEPRRFSDPDVEPPADVKKLTDHTGDLLVRITDGTWLWARIGDAEYPILDDASDGYDWSDVANELTPGHAFIEVVDSDSVA